MGYILKTILIIPLMTFINFHSALYSQEEIKYPETKKNGQVDDYFGTDSCRSLPLARRNRFA